MSQRPLRRLLPLLALLFLLPGVAAARPLGPDSDVPAGLRAAAVTAFLSHLADLLGSVWAAGSTDGDTGMSIDPNGPPGNNAGADSDTGMSIDPHG